MRECWQALKNLSYGVYVISAIKGEGEHLEMSAMTARFLTQVSTRPPRVALSIAKTRQTHDFLCASNSFAVSILARGQELLGGHFGLQSGRDKNKMAGVEWFTNQTGAPILKECCAWFECHVEAAHDMGHCTLFVAQVIGAGSTPGQPREPLPFRESDYFG